MPFTYPVTINLENKKCVVIGGGQVAQRKILSLLAQGAQVTVVSPNLTEALQTAWVSGQLIWLQGDYQEACLDGGFVVFAATNDHQVNSRIAKDCAQQNKLVNVCDDKAASNFTVSSYFTQGDLLVAVSTNGISPAIAAAIRNYLAEQFGAEYAQMLVIVEEARSRAKAEIQDEQKRRLFLQQLADMNLAEMLRQETPDRVKKRVEECLLSYWD